MIQHMVKHTIQKHQQGDSRVIGKKRWEGWALSLVRVEVGDDRKEDGGESGQVQAAG